MPSSQEIIDVLTEQGLLNGESFHLNWPAVKPAVGFRDDVRDVFLTLGREAMDVNGRSLDQFLEDCPSINLPEGMPEQWQKFGHVRKWELFISRHLFQAQRELLTLDGKYLIKDFYQQKNLPYIASLSHSKGLIRLAIAKKKNISYMGIDSERTDRLSLEKKGLWEKVSTEQDRQLLSESPGIPSERSVLFSCKEAIYKCAFPFYQKYFGFQEASLRSVAEDHLIFESHVLNQIGLQEIRVNFQIVDEYVHSVALLTTS